MGAVPHVEKPRALLSRGGAHGGAHLLPRVPPAADFLAPEPQEHPEEEEEGAQALTYGAGPVARPKLSGNLSRASRSRRKQHLRTAMNGLPNSRFRTLKKLKKDKQMR